LLSPGAGSLISNTQADRVATVDADVLSAFAQFNFNVSDDFTIQVGGRVTKDERDGFRTLAITGIDGTLLTPTHPQFLAPVVWANLLDITSTNLNDPQYGPTGAFYISTLGALPVSGSRDETKISPEVK
jgi:hypothetical protein